MLKYRKMAKITKAIIAVAGFGTRFLPATKQLLNLWHKHSSALVLGVQEVPLAQVTRYGIIKFKAGNTREVADLVEKPQLDQAPSRFASFGRFILNWEILRILGRQLEMLSGDQEFYLTEAISQYAQQKPVLAVSVRGKWLTTGDPLNWLKANIEFALEKKEIKKELTSYLRSLSRKLR